jgi:multiple sugar transport system substrate-binding protein
LALVSLIALGTIAGCGTDGREDGVVHLAFWNGFSGPDGTTMEAIVRQFNREHKDIQVKMEIIPWSTYYDKVTLGLAFGGAPDVFVLHANRVPEYASHDALACQDDLLAMYGPPASDFLPKPWTAGKWNGKRYGLPLDVHPLGLYYNVDLFKAAGIRRPPQTLDEFIQTAKRLTLRDAQGRTVQWGFAFTYLHSNGLTFMNQFGSGLLTDDLRQSAMDTPGTRAALNLMLRLIDVEKCCPRPEGSDAWLGFQTGKVAMAMEGVYMKSGLDDRKDLHYAAAPVPQFGPVRAVWAGSHCLAMPKNQDPKVRTAAWTFIKYLSDHSLMWAKGGQVPIRRSIIGSKEFRDLPVQSQFAKQIDYVRYEPFSVRFNQLTVFGDAAIEAVVNRMESPDQALTTASRRINRVLNQP